jgi:hypothetical protein
MNNEPVAWMLADKEAEHIRSIMAVQHDFVPEGCVEIPLYTSLVFCTAPQTKPLSDDEVIKIRQATKAKSTENWADTLAFARAIEERHGIK